jgi:hypothetical protein
MAIANATFIGSDIWNAELYGALSISSRLSAAIANQTAQVKIAGYFWVVNRRIESFLDQIASAVHGAELGKVKSAPKGRADVEKAISTVMNLHGVLDNIYQHSMRYRLNNVSRLAIGLNRLHRNAERVHELAMWLEDTLNPDFKDAFATAQAEFEHGETVPASEVCR